MEGGKKLRCFLLGGLQWHSERGLCFSLPIFFLLAHGNGFGGHPSHLCQLFLAKGMKVVKDVEGLSVFSTFFYHYAGQISFLESGWTTWELDVFLPNQGVDARLVELQHLDGQRGTNLDRKVGCVEDGSTWWPIGMLETWRWSPGRIRSIRVRPQQIQVAATFLILDPPKTPMPSWVTFNFVSIHRSPPDFFAARKPERQVQHAKAEDSTEVSRSSVHIPGARRGIFVTWGVGIRLVDIPDFHSRQDSTPPAKRSCRNHWFQHAHWNPRPFFWSWKIAGVFVQFTHGYVVLYWEDYTISRCIRGFS